MATIYIFFPRMSCARLCRGRNNFHTNQKNKSTPFLTKLHDIMNHSSQLHKKLHVKVLSKTNYLFFLICCICQNNCLCQLRQYLTDEVFC